MLPELNAVRGSSPLERAVLRDGLCVGHPHPEWWTGNSSRGVSVANANKAKQTCKVCPAFDNCRELSDRLEGEGTRNGKNHAFLACVYAGEGPLERARRRRNG